MFLLPISEWEWETIDSEITKGNPRDSNRIALAEGRVEEDHREGALEVVAEAASINDSTEYSTKGDLETTATGTEETPGDRIIGTNQKLGRSNFP